ncbi:MAG TPA: PDDEXK nuclease domain-containing protein [Alphaproteobacteria bacterium]|nr:PDDEXK nuclease domain-containing protein [Alphaproteobacteria bacterium]
MDSNLPFLEAPSLEGLYQRVFSYISQAKKNVLRSIDLEILTTYWHIGREIVEEEQKGAQRAEYGKAIISQLSHRLIKEFGKGYSKSTLADIRKFYLTYSKDENIFHAVSGKSELALRFQLSWTHYRILMRLSSKQARSFYEIEAIQNGWSARELERQVASLLFERLIKSKNKDEVLALAKKGQEIITPQDAIKDPVILEFLGLPESPTFMESDLEQALISNLQHFLLELGRGFAFVSRQKRLTIDGDHFYTDLVFYHTILKCYVIIDIKTHKLTHSDLGQIQLYVNYFDQEIATQGDNPTIGLILCTQKNDAVVKYTLGEKNSQIFASKYQFHLPTEEELEQELKKEVQMIQQATKKTGE